MSGLGVNKKTFEDLFHLEEEELIADLTTEDPVRFRRALQRNLGRRATAQTLSEDDSTASNKDENDDGIPKSLCGKLIELVDAGFMPRNCRRSLHLSIHYAKSVMQKRLKKLQLPVPMSTILYVMADPVSRRYARSVSNLNCELGQLFGRG